MLNLTPLNLAMKVLPAVYPKARHHTLPEIQSDKL